MNDSGEQRWPPWYGPVALLAGLLIASVAEAILVGGARSSNISPTVTDVATVIQDLAFVAVAVLLAGLLAPVRAEQFGLRAPPSRSAAAGIALLGLVVFYIGSAIWFAALNTSGAEKGFVKEIGGNAGTLGILGACVVACVVAPICEEILFRGFMFRALRNWGGFWPAALITAAFFGAVHGLSAPAVDLLPLALLGFVLCAVYQRTGSLYPCIAIHVLNNTIAFGADEHWGVRIIELTVGSFAVVALLLWLVQIGSARWMPVSD